MKAVVFSTFGGPEVLKLTDVETPTPGPNEVLVKVHAAAINPVDWHFVRGAPFPMRLMMGGLRGPKRPRQVGCDYAGVVAALGSGVTGFSAGDAVFGYCDSRTLAEYLTAPAHMVILKPERLTFEQAAGVPLAALTALQLLRKAQVQSGHHVLIVGAGGGIGSFAVQLAKAFGAHVTGVQSTGALDLVRSLGADRVIDYTTEDFTTGDTRYDVVFDNVCNRALPDVLRVIKPGGSLIPNGGGSPDKNVMRGLIRLLLTKPFVRQKILMGVTNPDGADLRLLADMIQAGTLRPVIDKVYPLADAAAAMRHLEGGHAHGKIVVTIAAHS